MSLRLRLLLIIGLLLMALWAAASVWMVIDLRSEFRATLDERLAASAQIVAGLVGQLPKDCQPGKGASVDGVEITARQGVAYQIPLLCGDMVARIDNGADGLDAAVTGYSRRTIQDENWRTFTLQQRRHADHDGGSR